MTSTMTSREVTWRVWTWVSGTSIEAEAGGAPGVGVFWAAWATVGMEVDRVMSREDEMKASLPSRIASPE
jgi:hypothetical protein